jgi:hypothetical protein
MAFTILEKPSSRLSSTDTITSICAIKLAVCLCLLHQYSTLALTSGAMAQEDWANLSP